MFTFDPDSKIACVRRPIVIAVHFVLSSKNDEKCSLRGVSSCTEIVPLIDPTLRTEPYRED